MAFLGEDINPSNASREEKHCSIVRRPCSIIFCEIRQHIRACFFSFGSTFGHACFSSVSLSLAIILLPIASCLDLCFVRQQKHHDLQLASSLLGICWLVVSCGERALPSFEHSCTLGTLGGHGNSRKYQKGHLGDSIQIFIDFG